MPELPEVETIKNTLKPILIGHTIKNVEIIRSCTVVGDEEIFVNTLKDKTFLDITRIGKYLIFHLSDELVIISHLRMEGKFYEYLENENNSKYARVVFHLNNNHKLCYDDSRCFGIMILSDEKSYKNEKEIKKLGPEPFFADANKLFLQTRKISKPIKVTLLDQSVISGLGNIYVDETLYASHIHPNTETNYLSLSDWQNIISNSVEILNTAIKLGGSTIKSYHPGKGVSGEFQTRIKIYGKQDEVCPICAKRYRFTIIGGRGTTYCPGCQNKKGRNIAIAITGKIASGKTSILNIFKNQYNIPCLSSDDIVLTLYKQKEVIEKVNKMFNLYFVDIIEKEVLRNYLKNHPNDIKKLDRYIHPLVGKQIENFLRQHTHDLCAVEVPLLFESKLDRLFDYIIATDIPKEKQLQLLKDRNKQNSEFLMTLYENNNVFENYKNKADCLVNNDEDLLSLSKKIDEIINKLRYLQDQSHL